MKRMCSQPQLVSDQRDFKEFTKFSLISRAWFPIHFLRHVQGPRTFAPWPTWTPWSTVRRDDGKGGRGRRCQRRVLWQAVEDLARLAIDISSRQETTATSFRGTCWRNRTVAVSIGKAGFWSTLEKWRWRRRHCAVQTLLAWLRRQSRNPMQWTCGVDRCSSPWTVAIPKRKLKAHQAHRPIGIVSGPPGLGSILRSRVPNPVAEPDSTRPWQVEKPGFGGVELP